MVSCWSIERIARSIHRSVGTRHEARRGEKNEVKTLQWLIVARVVTEVRIIVPVLDYNRVEAYSTGSAVYMTRIESGEGGSSIP